MYPWGLESSQSVHGDERGMLRIISPPLGEDPTSDRDPHHLVMDGLVVGRS